MPHFNLVPISEHKKLLKQIGAIIETPMSWNVGDAEIRAFRKKMTQVRYSRYYCEVPEEPVSANVPKLSLKFIFYHKGDQHTKTMIVPGSWTVRQLYDGTDFFFFLI